MWSRRWGLRACVGTSFESSECGGCMRKKRIQSHESKTRGSTHLKKFIGVSLSGGKADKACIAVIEFYPDQKKIFLSEILEKIKTEELISADFKIHEIIHQYEKQVETVAFDSPLSLPKCLTCRLRCPGYETCEQPEIIYMRELYQNNHDKKKPKKMYTPYTQRCVEAFLSEHESDLDIQHALGANHAPMTARAHFICRRLKVKTIEVFPKLTVWRLGHELRVNKSNLKIYRNSVGGDQSRAIFLQAMVEKLGIFVYQQDLKTMVENFHAFDAFIAAYTGLLKYLKKTEPRPKNFPKSELWIEYPTAPKK